MSNVSTDPTEDIMLAAHDALEAAREHLRGKSDEVDLYDQVSTALYAVRGRPAQTPTEAHLKVLLHHQRALGNQVMNYLLAPYTADRLILCDRVHRADAELREALRGGGYLKQPWDDWGVTAVMARDRRTLIDEMRKEADVLREADCDASAELLDRAAREMEYDLLVWAPPR